MVRQVRGPSPVPTLQPGHEHRRADRVARAHGIGLGVCLGLRGLPFAAAAFVDDERPVFAAGQHHRFKFEVLPDRLGRGGPEPIVEVLEFFVVALHPSRVSASVFDDSAIDERRPKVDVEEADGVPGLIQEPPDGAAGLAVTLRQRAEADRVAVPGKFFKLGVPLEVVPGGVLNDFVLRLMVRIKADEDPAGGAVGVELQVFVGHAALVEFVTHGLTQGVVARPGEHDAADLWAELVGMDGDIKRSATEPFFLREDVVEGFPEADHGEPTCLACVHGDTIASQAGGAFSTKGFFMRADATGWRTGHPSRWGAVLALVLGGWAMPLAGQPGRGDDAALPVYVNDSREAAELAGEMRALLQENRDDDAAKVLDRILERHADRLMESDSGMYQGVAGWAMQVTAEDPGLISAYRRVHEPYAERLLSLALERDLPEAELVALTRRYAPTTSALTARLWLAGLALQRGDGEVALAQITLARLHPAAAETKIRLDALQVHALLMQGDNALASVLASTVMEQDPELGQALLDDVERWRLGLAIGLGPDDPLASASSLPSEALAQPLWRHDDPGQALAAGASRPEGLFQQGMIHRQGAMVSGQDESALTIPHLAGGRLLLNRQQSVIGLDRVSGRPLWRYDEGAPLDQSNLDPRMQQLARQRAAASPPRGVASSHDAIYAVIGSGDGLAGAPGNFAVHLQRRGMLSNMVLVCLDPETGQRRWRRTVREIAPEIEGAELQGTPSLVNGLLIVQLGKASGMGFQDTYLVALRPEDGSPVWDTHLSSVATLMNRGSGHGSAWLQIQSHDGWLYVSDRLAVAACLNARTGALRWLRILEDMQASRRGRITVNRQSLRGQPLIIPAGLVVPMLSGARPARLLDPVTGADLDEQDRLRDGVWQRGLSQFMEVDGDLIVMGPVVARLDGRTLQPRWVTPLEGGVSGLGQRDGDTLAIGTATDLALIDLRDGRIRARRKAEPGNLALEGGELFHVGARSVTGYMTWDHAQARLLAQVAAMPRDVQPALSLAYIARQSQRWAGLEQGVDLAIEAASRADDEKARRQVLALVLDYAGTEAPGGVGLKRTLFDRAATLTRSAKEEVLYHLVKGAFEQQQGRLQVAAEHYQAVLGDPTLSAVSHQDGGLTRQAGLEATRRLREMLLESGRTFYARFDAEAGEALAQWQDRSDQDVKDLLSLIDRYPVAQSTPRAALLAAERFSEIGDSHQAIGYFRRAWRQHDEPLLRARIAGGLTSHYLGMGRSAQAARWLREVARQYPELQPWRQDGSPVAVSAWLAELESQSAIALQQPAIGTRVQGVIRLSGRLVPHVQGLKPAPSAGLLLEHGDQRVWVDPSTGRARWTQPRGESSFHVVQLREPWLVLWSEELGLLKSLNPKTGDVLWTQAPLKAADPAETEGSATAGQAAQQRLDFIGEPVINAKVHHQRIVVRNGRVMEMEVNGVDRLAQLEASGPPQLRLGESIVCVASSTGQVSAVELDTGRVLWQTQTQGQTRIRLAVSDDTVALASTTQPAEGRPRQHLELIDLYTGEHRVPPLVKLEPTIDMVFLDRGGLVILERESLRRLNHDNGQTIWTTGFQSAIEDQLWAHRGRLLVQDTDGYFMLFDAETGAIQTRLPLPKLEGLPRRVTAQDDGFVINDITRASSVSRQGQPRWSHTLGGADRELLRVVAGRGPVAVLTRQGGDRQLGLSLIDDRFGRVVDDVVLPMREPNSSPQPVILSRHEGMLAVTAHHETLLLLVPPSEGDRQPAGR